MEGWSSGTSEELEEELVLLAGWAEWGSKDELHGRTGKEDRNGLTCIALFFELPRLPFLYC
jgi:hypothetical protein